MRIVIISNLFPPATLGGFELAALDLALELGARGHEVRVLTTPAFDQVDSESVDVSRVLGLKTYRPLPNTTGSVARFLHFESAVSQIDNTLILRELLIRFRPDHVMGFNLVGIGAIAILDLLRRSGISYSLNLGDTVPIGVTDGIDRGVLAEFGCDPADYFSTIPSIAVSERLVDEIERSGIAISTDRLVMPRGISADLAPTGSTVKNAIPTFAFVGSIHDHKGVPLILEAAQALARDGREFAIEFFGAGEIERFEAEAHALGIADRLTFHGHQPRSVIFEALSRADALTFPTWEREPLGNAALQAAFVGCVPILTAQCGASEYLSDGVHAIKIDRSVASLTLAMATVLDDRAWAHALGARASAYTQRTLAAARYFDHVERFIETHVDAAQGRSADMPTPRELIELDSQAQERLHEQLRALEGQQ